MNCRTKWIIICNPNLISFNPKKASNNISNYHWMPMRPLRTTSKPWQEKKTLSQTGQGWRDYLKGKEKGTGFLKPMLAFHEIQYR